MTVWVLLCGFVIRALQFSFEAGTKQILTLQFSTLQLLERKKRQVENSLVGTNMEFYIWFLHTHLS